MASTIVSTTSESVVVSTTWATSLQWHQSKVDTTATSHDTEEVLLGIREAEWSKLLDDRRSTEPVAITGNKLLEHFLVLVDKKKVKALTEWIVPIQVPVPNASD